MIKIDENYTDYRDDTDPKYPGGKAVNATTTEGVDGTPLLADWMNDINGAMQAIFIEAFGDINRVSGKPDNVQESDVLKAIKKIIVKLWPGLASQGDTTDKDLARGVGLVKTVNNIPNKLECSKDVPWAASPHWVYNLLLGNTADDVKTAVEGSLRVRLGINTLARDTFRYRGRIKKADLDNAVVTGSYGVESSGYAGALLVFETGGSTGIVQFYKDGYQNEPWKYRNAIDSDPHCWTEWQTFSLKQTTGWPSSLECQRNESWAASPFWVYNLLIGAAQSDVNEVVTKALKERVAGGIKRIEIMNEGGFIEWDNGFKIEAISFAIGNDWSGVLNGATVLYPLAFNSVPVFISSFRWGWEGDRGRIVLSGGDNDLLFIIKSSTQFFVSLGSISMKNKAFDRGCLVVMGA